MKKPEFLKYHRYCFEMEMEINSALTFSAGELCALLTDGLFALDDMGTLFPGVKSPGVGERLTGAHHHHRCQLLSVPPHHGTAQGQQNMMGEKEATLTPAMRRSTSNPGGWANIRQH